MRRCLQPKTNQTEQNNKKAGLLYIYQSRYELSLQLKSEYELGQTSTQNNLGKKGNVKLSKNLSQEGSYCQ